MSDPRADTGDPPRLGESDDRVARRRQSEDEKEWTRAREAARFREDELGPEEPDESGRPPDAA